MSSQHTPQMTRPMITLMNALGEDPTVQLHGYELIKRTKLKSGTLYPALARLEAFGWLESHWEEIDSSEEGRPRRKLYKLTAHGAKAVRQALDELRVELASSRAPSGLGSPAPSPRGLSPA